MTYQDLKERLKNFIVLTVDEVRMIEPNFVRANLNLWQNKGYLKKLRRGYYAFADTPLDESTLFLIANKLYEPSYVSFESALSYYGLIPEGVYAITSASTRKTSRFKTPFAEFIYRSVKPRLNFGYRLEKTRGRTYKIAEIEKAVLDYLYLNPTIIEPAGYHEWRFDGASFLERADLAKMRRFAVEYGSKTFLERTEKLLLLMKG